MHEYYIFNKDAVESDILDIVDGARNIWTKNLPPLFAGILTKEIEESLNKMFDGEGEVGEINCELAIENLIIPAAEVVCSDLNSERLKKLLSGFVCNTDGSTLYDVLKSRISEKEREELLKKSYSTKEEAVANGIESPFEYNCCECGKSFWAEWRSNYSSAAICPVCETENR